MSMKLILIKAIDLLKLKEISIYQTMRVITNPV